MKVNTPLWKHQQDLHDFAISRFHAETKEWGDAWNVATIFGKYAWWIAGCGTGKTLAVYKIIQTMDFKRVLVLTTKAAIRSAWVIDAQKHTEGITVVAPEGTVKDKVKVLKSHKGTTPMLFVINYESAWRMSKELRDFGFDFVVSDESHKLKSHNSKQSIESAWFCEPIPYKLCMTGTAWDDRPTDVYGQVRFFDASRRGRVSNVLNSYSAFFERYVTYFTYQNVKIVKEYKRQEELREIIKQFTIFVDSESVLDLPPEVHIERKLAMPKAIARAYQDMQDTFVTYQDDAPIVADTVLEQTLRLHQITSGYLPSESGEVKPLVDAKDNPKLQETLAILDEIGGKKPVVIFTRFKQDVAILKQTLEAVGIQVSLLTGSVQQHVEWQHEGKGQVLIANIQAGSAGVDLTRSRYVIYYSIGHSRTDYLQSLYRVRRKGADMNHPVTYYHLLMENSIDEDIRLAMTHKEDIAQFLIEGLTRIER